MPNSALQKASAIIERLNGYKGEDVWRDVIRPLEGKVTELRVSKQFMLESDGSAFVFAKGKGGLWLCSVYPDAVAKFDAEQAAMREACCRLS